jgi:hypothetical protein
VRAEAEAERTRQPRRLRQRSDVSGGDGNASTAEPTARANSDADLSKASPAAIGARERLASPGCGRRPGGPPQVERLLDMDTAVVMLPLSLSFVACVAAARREELLVIRRWMAASQPLSIPHSGLGVEQRAGRAESQPTAANAEGAAYTTSRLL